MPWRLDDTGFYFTALRGFKLFETVFLHPNLFFIYLSLFICYFILAYAFN